jgi:archaellum component FlaF (FlaF/FlaG flagellin family)
VLFIQQGQLGTIFPQSLQASDFLGEWYNTNSNPYNDTISGLYITENQGTYTIETTQGPCAVIDGTGSCQPLDWGTSTLSISPPNAHAFYTFQYGSVALQLSLLNATSMRVQESFEGSVVASLGSSKVQTENFSKMIPVSNATSTSTTAQSVSQVVSSTFTLPAPQGGCGVSLKAGFNATAGQILTGTVSASTVVGVYVMTPAADQAWVYQFNWDGGSCTPSNFVASLQGSASYDVNVRIPADGNYEIIIINPSATTITVQIILNLIAGTSSYSQTVQSEQYITTTSTTSITTQTSTSISGQGTSTYTESEKLVLSSYHWDMSSNSIWVAITNMGTVSIDLPQSSVFINGIPAPPPPSSCGTLAPGWNCGYAFTPPSGNWVFGTTYTLTIETPDGVIFSFPIVAGESG